MFGLVIIDSQITVIKAENDTSETMFLSENITPYSTKNILAGLQLWSGCGEAALFCYTVLKFVLNFSGDIPAYFEKAR